MYRVILTKLANQLASRFPGPEIPRSLEDQRHHTQAIQRIVDRWQAGQLSIEEKRRLILQENRSYHSAA